MRDFCLRTTGPSFSKGSRHEKPTGGVFYSGQRSAFSETSICIGNFLCFGNGFPGARSSMSFKEFWSRSSFCSPSPRATSVAHSESH